MTDEFTVDEIRDAARMARVHCPGFTEDMFESLMGLERRIADSGYLAAVQGLIRLSEEKGISCTEALDACKRLMVQKAKLEREVPALEDRANSLITQIKQANMEYEQVKRATSKAQQELMQVRSEYAAAEKRLESFNKELEKERQHISIEVENSYQQANVTKEEVATAGSLKAAAESHGFTLELMLNLSKEFAGHKNAREELAKSLEDYDSLTNYLDKLADSAEKERAKVISEINGLESQKKRLAGESEHLRSTLSRLQADIAYEEDLRHFHRRYSGLSGLIDHLTTWDQVCFMRCGNPVNAAAGVIDKKLGNPHFWTDKPPVVCPHCGYQHLFFDTEIYQYLKWPAERPLKLTLGE